MREQILKKNTTIAKPNAGSSGMALVLSTTHPRQPLHNGLVDAA